MQKESGSYVVAIGNAFDGISLYGPFGSADEAGQWAEFEAGHAEWNVMSILSPRSLTE